MMMRLTAGAVALAAVSSAHGQLTLVNNQNLNQGQLVAIAFNPSNDLVYVYDDFASVIRVYDRTLASQGTIPFNSASTNDVDLDFAAGPINVGGTVAPAGTLLIGNGDAGNRLVAVNPADGSAISSVILQGGGSMTGIAYDAAAGRLYSLRYNSQGFWAVNPENGATVGSFVLTNRCPDFSLFYSDMDVLGPSGRVYIVSDSQDTIREMSPEGRFFRDIDVGSIGVVDMTGIAIDDARGEAWISSRNGRVYHVAGLAAAPEVACPADIDGSCQTQVADIFMFLGFWFSADARADFDRNGQVQVGDIFAFLSAWFAGC